MTCEECELALSTDTGEEAGPRVREHLEGCEGCRAFRSELSEVLALAALEPVSAAEERRLSELEAGALTSWNRARQRRTILARAGSLALAAGLGALIASAALLSSMPRAVIATPRAAMEPPPETLDVRGLEVSWSGEDALAWAPDVPPDALPDVPSDEELEEPEEEGDLP